MPLNEYDEMLSGKPAPVANEYDSLIAEQKTAQREVVLQNVKVAESAEPDRRAQAIRISDQVGVPVEIVERNFDTFSKQAQSQANDYDAIIEKSPGLSKWLESPDNAVLGKDDLEPLSKIEQSSKFMMGPGGDLVRALQRGYQNLKQGSILAGQAYGLVGPEEAADMATESAARAKALEAKKPDYLKEFEADLQAEAGDMAKAFERFGARSKELWRTKTLDALKDLGSEGGSVLGEGIDILRAIKKRPEGLGLFIAEQLPNAAPSIAGGAIATAGGLALAGMVGITGAVPLAVIGTLAGAAGAFGGGYPTEVATWFTEALGDRGVDTSNRDALLTAFRDPKLMAAVRGEAERKGLGTAGIDALASVFTFGLSRVGGGAAAKGTSKVLRQAAKGAAQLGVETVGEGAGEFVGQGMARGFDKASLQDAIIESIAGFGQSVGTAVVANTVGQVVPDKGQTAPSAPGEGQKSPGADTKSMRAELPKDTAEAAHAAVERADQSMKALSDAEALANLGEAIKESKTAKRLPEKIAELVEASVGDGKAVYFQADDWDAYWTGKSLSPAKAAADILGDGGQAYTDAKAAGTALSIPLPTYAAQVGTTEHFEGLLPVTRAALDAPSFAEARTYLQSLRGTMAELAKEAQAAGVPATAADAVAPAADTPDAAGDTPAAAPKPPTPEQLTKQALSEIRARTEEQLVAAGRPRAEAKRTAEVRAMMLEVLAKDNETTVQALAQRYGLTITGEPQAQAATGESETVLNQDARPPAPPFFSKLLQTIEEKMGNSATVEQVRGLIRDVKEEERKWLGIDEFLKGKEKVSKAELVEFLRANQLEIREVTKTLDEDKVSIAAQDEFTKFQKYQLPGGENYREVLFTLPDSRAARAEEIVASRSFEEGRALQEKYGMTYAEALKARRGDGYRSSHWDESNVLAHVRLNDRVDADGKKVLFVEEIQSDWHQDGRKKGYRDGNTDTLPPGFTYKFDEAMKTPEFRHQVIDPAGAIAGMGPTKEAAFADFNRVSVKDSAVPDAPFRKTWHEFALKRILRMAAEGGYDRVAWTTGEQQAERYDLSTQVSRIEYEKTDDGKYEVDIYDTGGNAIGEPQTYDESQLDGVVGKELAQKIVAGDGKKRRGSQARFLEGLDLKVGGEGMKGFYDKILVDFANKFGKKFGAKVGETRVDSRASGEATRLDVSRADDGSWQITNASGEVYSDSVGGSYEGYESRDEAEDALSQISIGADATVVHALDITPALRDAALKEGFSLFQVGDNTPLGQITIGSDLANSLIRLFKGANASTAVHELSHHYLAILEDLGSQADATETVKARLAEARKLLGNSGEKFTEAQQEKFARTFEQYLQDGKAPTPRLRQLFHEFRTWLTNIYRSARGLGIEVSAEMRNFFDRMLVSDQELQQANETQNFQPLFAENPESFGMSKEMAEKYKQTLERAKEASSAELTRKLMEPLEERASDEYEAERERVRFEVEAQVNARPEYKALFGLRDGTRPDGTVFKGAMPLSTELTREAMGYKKLPEAVRKLRVTKPEGLHPDVAAELYGFPNGKAMLDALTQAPDRDALVERLTDQRMQEQRPDLLISPELSDEAMKAAHNDHRAELLRMELEHIASNQLPLLKDAIRRVSRTIPTTKAVRAQAARIIADQKVRDVRPIVYQRAEAKAAKEAGEALARGDFERMFDAKRRELLNHELYRAAVAATEDVRKSVKEFRRLSKADDAISKSRDMDLVNVARAVLAAFGLGRPTDKPASAYLEAIQKYDPSSYEGARALYDSATQTVTDYQNARYDDFVAMKDAVDSLWDLARDTKTIAIEGKRVAIESAKTELIGQMGPGPSAPLVARLGDPTGREKVKLGWLSLKAGLRRVESWATAMDGGASGPFRKYLWNPVSEATAKFRGEKRKVIEQYLELVKGIEKTLTWQPIAAPELGQGVEFRDKGALLTAILHTGNDSNQSKLVGGYEWGAVDAENKVDMTAWNKFVERMWREGVLTKADYDFAQGVWDLNESLKPEAQKAHKAMYGYYFNEVTAREVVTPFGTYRGGYMPARPDPIRVDRASQLSDQEMTQRNDNSYAFPTTGRGATKTRVENYRVPLALDLKLVPQHLDWVLRFIHIEPAVKQVARITRSGDFTEALAKIDPMASKAMLNPWLQRAAQQLVELPSTKGRGFDTFWRELRTRTGMQAMFGSVTNTLQNFTGWSVAAVRVKPKHLRGALWTYMRSSKKLAEQVTELSPFMKTRIDAQMFEVQQTIDQMLLNPNQYERARDFAKKHAYFMQSATQNIVDVVTWQGAFEQAVEEGVPDAEAIRRADSAVRETQGSMAPEDISRFETGTAFERAFFMFYTYFNNLSNFLGTEFGNTYRELGLRKGAGRLLYIYAFGFAIPAMMSEAIVRAMSGNGLDEDDDDEYMNDILNIFFGSQLRMATAMLPFVGQAINSGYNHFNNKWYDDRITTSPAVSMVESAVGAPYSVYKAIADDGSSKRAVRDTLTLLGLLSGTPLAPLSRPASYLIDVNEGNADPANAFDFARGLVTGRSGQR